MNGTAKQMKIVEAGMRLKEVSGMHPRKWKSFGEKRISELNQGQVPKVLAVGPRIVGGLSKKYVTDIPYGGTPGKIFEVTTKNNGWLDSVGAGSVFYAVRHLGVKKVDIWSNGNSTFKNTEISVNEIVGYLNPEIRMASTFGSRINEIGYADAVVIGCSDSRVQVHDMYDNVIVVSNAGNILSPTAIDVMLEAVKKGVPVLMVLGHTKCGAVGAAVSGNREPELKKIVSIVENNIGDNPTTDPEVMNALVSATILRGEHMPAYTSEKLMQLQQMIKSNGVEVMATFFDLSTGEVKEL